VFWTPHNGGHWMVTGYANVTNGLRDFETYSSVLLPKEVLAAMKASMPEGVISPATALPASVDPPEHTQFRTPLNAVFSPKVAIGLKEEIRGLAIELIERVRPNGKCELLGDISSILPVQMFLKIYGLPLERQQEYRAIVDSVMSDSAHDFNEIMRKSQILIAAYNDTLIERRDKPRDDIISALWKLEINGEPMTLERMQSYSLSLFLAGLDTVMNAMALGTHHLAIHPELQAKLRANPKLIPQMTDEMLRLYSFAIPQRIVARDTVVDGATLKAGDRVLFFLASADRDPNQFEEPTAFRLERETKAHASFGAGPHRCLGMHLARVELHVFYEELLSRIPLFRLDPEYRTTYHGGIVTGPNQLHLLWDA
jgi:cytochrome P450